MEPFLGEVAIFAFGVIPKGYLACNGQLLAINQNQALFALLGTTYGGNGINTFALPDYRGKVAVGQGNGYTIGATGGSETVPLTLAQMPSHSHTATGSNTLVSTGNPGTTVTLGAFQSTLNYANTIAAGTSALNGAAVSNAGQGQAHTNLQPSLALNVCIATQGIFPSRN